MAHVYTCSVRHAKGVATKAGLTSPALEIEGGSVMRRTKLVLAVVTLLVMLMAVGTAPAMADRSNNNDNSRTITRITQSCSSGDISVGDNNDNNNGDNTRIVVN